MHVLAIALGGALGASLRAALNAALATRLGTAFPHGVYAVNVLGSFLLGFLSNTAARAGTGLWYEMLATGFCGSLTTFSTFAYGGTALLVERRYAALAAHVAVNVVPSYVAALLGLALASLN